MPRQRAALPVLGPKIRLATGAWLEGLLAIWQRALLPFLGTRVLIFLVAAFTDFSLLSTEKAHLGKPKFVDATHFPNLLLVNWVHFDSGFYLGLAIGGYPAQRPHGHYSSWEFYPLFPALIHPLGRALGGHWSRFSIAALIVANVAALIAVAYLFVLVRREYGERVAQRATLFLALFPSSFFLSAAYSESVFLAPAVACLYYARARRWLGAGICGALATLARGPGILLLVPVGWELWQDLSERYAPMSALPSDTRRQRIREWWASRLRGPLRAARVPRAWAALLALLLIPLAQVAFMTYAKIRTGTFQANLIAIKTWHHYLSWPWQPVLHDLVYHPASMSDPMVYDPFLQSIVMLSLFTIFTIWAFFRLPTAYALYALAMFLVPLCTGYISSLPRYYLVIFPAFMLLALWSDPEQHPQRFIFLIVASAMSLTMLTAFFALGLPAAGI